MKTDSKKHILLVDDNPTFLQLVSALLKDHGYDVSPAADGDLALDKLNQAGLHFDVLLIDLILPRRNGLDILRAVRRHPLYKGVPSVLLTGVTPDPTLTEDLKELESISLDKEKTLDFLIPMLDDLFKRTSARS